MKYPETAKKSKSKTPIDRDWFGFKAPAAPISFPTCFGGLSHDLKNPLHADVTVNK